MKTARNTIELDKELLKKLKLKAIDEEKTLKEMMNELVRKGLETTIKAKRKKKFVFKAYDMGLIKTPLTREQIYEDI